MKNRYSLSLLLLIPAVVMAVGDGSTTTSTTSSASSEGTYAAWIAKSKEGDFDALQAGLAALGIAETEAVGVAAEQLSKARKKFSELCKDKKDKEGNAIDPDEVIAKAAYELNLKKCESSLAIAKANLAGATEINKLLDSLADVEGPTGGRTALNRDKLRIQKDAFEKMASSMKDNIENIEGEIASLNVYGDTLAPSSAFECSMRSAQVANKNVQRMLNLEGLDLNDNHIATLCKALAELAFINQLDFANNPNFTDEGLKAVAELLGDNNERFTRIDIDNTGVSKVGFVTHLLGKLKTSKTKLSLYLINTKDAKKLMNRALEKEALGVLSKAKAPVTFLEKK